MNDSLRSDIFVRHTPETIACGCIHLAARLVQTPLPNSPQWYRPFGVTDSDVEDVSIRILSVYRRAKQVDVDRLDKTVKELRAKQQEEKKLKLIVGTKVVIRSSGDSEAVENSNSNSNIQGSSLKTQWLQGTAGEIVPMSNGTKREHHITVSKDDHKDELRNHNNRSEINSQQQQRTQRDVAGRAGFQESHEQDREREKRRSDERHSGAGGDKDGTNNDDDRRSGSAKKSHKRKSRERSRSRTVSPDRRRRNRGRQIRSRSRSRENGRRRDRR